MAARRKVEEASSLLLLAQQAAKAGVQVRVKASDRLQVHVTSVTHAIRRLEEAQLVRRLPHPTDGRTTLVEITDLGRSTVEDATSTLNREVFADVGMPPEHIAGLVDAIHELRHNAGDF